MEKKEKGKRRTANEWPFPFEKGGIERSGKFSHLSAMVVVFEYENEVETSNEYVSRPEISVLI